MIKLFLFQTKEENNDWKEVHEQYFMDELYKHHKRLSPVIREMLRGSFYQYDGVQFRIVPRKEDY